MQESLSARTEGRECCWRHFYEMVCPPLIVSVSRLRASKANAYMIVHAMNGRSEIVGLHMRLGVDARADLLPRRLSVWQ